MTNAGFTKELNYNQNSGSKLNFLIPIITHLNLDGRKSLCHEILDFYFTWAQSLSDFDILGSLSLKCDHRQLYLKCAEYSLHFVTNSDELYNARTNYFKALNMLNYPVEAEFYIKQNLIFNPNDLDLRLELALNLALQGRREESENQLLDIMRAYPEQNEKLKYTMSGKLLREGKLAAGVLAFIDTFKPDSALFVRQLGMTKWTGQIEPGRTIYVEGEGGIGDEIINIRFFHKIQELGMRPILYSTWSRYRSDTINFFRRHGFEVVSEKYSIDSSQLWTSMMSLPGYLNLEEKDLWQGPYLQPLRNPVNNLTSRKFRVGIKCNGNPYFGQDEYRKIPLNVIVDSIPESCEIYYIDKSDMKDHPRVINLADRINSWEDTLDFIDQMDCIISSCTSLVHAAGAIGKTTLVAVPICEYYIWTSSRRDTSTPWYGDNFFVYKQTKIRDWSEPFQKITEHLQKIIDAKSSTM